MSSITVGTLTSTTVNVTGTITLPNGIVLPSFSDANRPGSPTAGQMIYNTTTEDVQIWNGTAWSSLAGSVLRNWTDSTRPGSPSAGEIGWNTETLIVEIYDGTQWAEVGQTGAEADPGEVLFVTTGSHTWTVPDGVESVSVVAIGGGGGGSGDHDGGGGCGGGLGWRNNIAVTPGANISVTVGRGGAGADSDSQNGQAGAASWFQSTNQVWAGGGDGGRGNYDGSSIRGGNFVGAGGGRGGDDNYGSTWRTGGKGAGGYTGRGGDAGIPYNVSGESGQGKPAAPGAAAVNYGLGTGGSAGGAGEIKYRFIRIA